MMMTMMKAKSWLHLLSTYFVSGIILNHTYVLSDLILTTTQSVNIITILNVKRKQNLSTEKVIKLPKLVRGMSLPLWAQDRQHEQEQ